MTPKKSVSTDKTAELVKIVYFDEESASDLLDIVAAGNERSSRESTKERVGEVEAVAGAKAAAKFNWLPTLPTSDSGGEDVAP